MPDTRYLSPFTKLDQQDDDGTSASLPVREIKHLFILVNSNQQIAQAAFIVGCEVSIGLVFE